MRRGAKPAKARVSRKAPKNEGARVVRDLEKRLAESRKREAEALEQQTATSEILRVISSSPTDIHPVFDTIVQSAVRLCAGVFGIVFRYDGHQLSIVAHHKFSSRAIESIARSYPAAASPESMAGRAVLRRGVVHVSDVTTPGPDTGPRSQQLGLELGYRAFLSVPMLRHGEPIGVINVTRREPRPFTDKQIALLQTFADQAVIAIENVRLFTELQERNREVTEALTQQTATSEILRVIAGSPTDLQPVLDALVESAGRLCAAADTFLLLVEGDQLRVAALHPPVEGGVISNPIQRGWVAGRAVMELRTVHVEDLANAQSEFPLGWEIAARLGHRTALAMPLLRKGVSIGALFLRRREVRQFSDKEIALLQTFADQAVIAIENVRLFTELQARNKDVTDALEQQTATAEILRVISRSHTDIQPVFDTIADNAVKLFRPWSAAVYRFDGEFMHVAAVRGGLPGSEQYLREQGRRRPTRDVMAGRCIIDRSVIHVPDFETDPDVPMAAREIARHRGFRATINVPMLRDEQPIGVISVSRAEAGAFSPAEIDLLLTFADQAVVAIENARLFTELQARTAQLTRSVEQLTALGDVGRALSSTLDLGTVLQTIVTRASQLAGADACSVFEYDEATEAFHLRTTHNLDQEVVALVRRTPTRKGEGVQGRMAVTRQPVQIPDIAEEDAYRGPLRDILLRTGTRAVLAIPMLLEDKLIGGLTVNKKTPGEFSPEFIELLKTFATQSALAIQNARLFREIEEKSRQLGIASQHKSEFLANMSHELRTPLNAIIGFSEVLTERMFGELNEKQDEYLKDIYASGTHLLSLINDILDLSKIEAGRMELELTDFHLPQAIDNALTLVRERASRRGIALHQSVEERLGEITGDERKVKQVLLNLLSNALKFTPEGGRIEVRAAPVDSSVEVSVSDTGVGIAAEDQEAVFEEFRQVGTSTAKQEGTGLGLALCRKFVELHGGRIGVTSQVGVGSTFTFSIPMRRNE